MNATLPVALLLALLASPLQPDAQPLPPASTDADALVQGPIQLPPTTCDADLGRWSPIPRGGDDFEPLETPPNTATAIWSCRVGGRLLVVKALLQWRGVGECSGTVMGMVSAWVDGVKLVDRESTGDSEECLPGDGSRPRLDYISLTPKGGLRVCQEDFAEGYRPRQVCRNRRLSGQPDPAYLPPDHITPPGVVLISGTSPLCEAVTPELGVDGPAGDPSLLAKAVPTTEGWANSVLYFEDEDRPVTFDMDNDGRPDLIEMRAAMKVHGQVGQFYWRPQGADRERAWTPPDLLGAEESEGSRDYVAYGYRPVTLNGRAYLYVRERPAFEERLDPEVSDGGIPGPLARTRALMELRPDGTASILCVWGPRPRPEEFL